MVSFSVLHLLAASATLAAALPAAQPTNISDSDRDVAAREALQLGTAIHGALDLPTTIQEMEMPEPTPGPEFDVAEAAVAAAKQMTVVIINKHGADIKTVHTGGAAVGNPGAGKIGNGKTAHFVVNAGWHGTVAINDAKHSDTTGDESLIEGSFVNQGAGHAQGDVNISFVDGFSVPIVCWCDENNVTTGCNKDLNKLNKCPNPNGQGSCKNPLRNDLGARSPTKFFSPCHAAGGAYTFPSDDKANNLNQKCPKEKYTCCVGTSCRSHP